MRSELGVFVALAMGASALLPAYSKCGGIAYTGAWECEIGFTCTAVKFYTTEDYPNYQCQPTGGPIDAHAFPWGQCGGDGFIGATVCPPGWSCLVQNVDYSQCLQDDPTPIPPSSTPELAGPGAQCAQTAIERGYPSKCVPGYTCTGPGAYGWWVCLLNSKPISSTVIVPTTTPVKSTLSTKITTKTTTSSIKKATTKTKKTTTKTKKATPAIPTATKYA